MRFPADNSADRQDPLIAPLGTLVDQSEVKSEKEGARTSWTRGDLFTPGLELHVGLDVVKDETEQSLALTNRVWVPPMKYTSIAPYAQLSYDIGPVTISGGMRREDGELEVDDYTTTFFRNRAFVRGRQARLPGRPVQCRRDLAHHARLVGVRLVQRGLHAAEHRHPAA